MQRMPTVFFGHGNPMNALDDNRYTQAWRAIGASMPPPRAIVMISAHWYTAGLAVTAQPNPRTIHDFGGFPRALYDVRYPAPGDPNLAQRVAELLAPQHVAMDSSWGIDHGTWSVLRHAFPNADIPVIQLSLDEALPPEVHYAIGERLRPLRDEGVLIAGSGNVVHNLHAIAWGAHAAHAYPWAAAFEETVKHAARSRAFAPLLAYETLGEDAQLSVPTPEHFLPFLYVCAASDDNDRVDIPVDGIDAGSISMLTLSFAPQHERRS